MSVTVRTRGRLPHWSRPGADYFITFRTLASISPETLAALRVGRYTPDAKRNQIEAELDRCTKGDFLRGAVAEVVANSIRWNDCRNYTLHAWCVMPNHVHLLIRLIQGKRLAPVMQGLKSVTAHQINKLLARTGPVWEREYFDRLVRPGNFEAVKNYIVRNPERAKLANWNFVGTAVP